MKRISTLLMVLWICAFRYDAAAQQVYKKGVNDTIVVYGVVIAGDTLPMQYLEDVNIISTYVSQDRRNQLARLRYNVYTVYPYAVAAARVLNDLDAELGGIEGRRDKKKYLKAVEDKLNERFKDNLKNMTTTQGFLLVKLINRQTGRDCYSIIKQLKGGFNARLWQTAAFFFDNNLKTQYDPYNTDKDIEMIVREIESKNYYNHTSNINIRK